MATQKRKPGKSSARKGRRDSVSKRAGGQLGDSFRAKLEGLIERAGSQRRFAELLWTDVAAKVDRSPRVAEWRRGRSWPSADNLQLIATKFDVSIDWLLGFPVPERRSDREPIGELAVALMHHVVRNYNSRTKRQRRDGLADAMGGRLDDADSPRPENPGDPWPPIPYPGETLPDGRIVTHHGMMALRVLDVDPLAFLELVCDRVYRDAEAWEAANEESEREAVRNTVRVLWREIDSVAEEMGHDQARVYEWLLDGALNPLDTRAQAGVQVAFQMFRQGKVRNEAWEAHIHQLVAKTIADVAHQSERADSND